MLEEISAEARAMIGKETVGVYEVTRKDIRRFAQAVCDLNPLYVDEEYAKKTRYGGLIAPPLFCHSFAHSDVPSNQLREDGLPTELDIPFPGTRVVGGASSLELGEPVRPGDVITAVVKIADIHEKRGKNGILFFVVVDNTYSNQRGQVVHHEQATYVYR